MQRMSPFHILSTVFLGLSISLGYSLLSSVILYFLEGKSGVRSFLVAYNSSFQALLSLGLILGIAITAFSSQNVFATTIESAFARRQLAATDYFHYKRRFLNKTRSIVVASEFFILAFSIFSACQFPLHGLAEALMIIAACTQYALGAYAGRKIYSAVRVLNSLLDVSLDRNFYKNRELAHASAYVYIISAALILFFCVHLIGYGGGPFLYGSLLGESARTFLILPVLMATAVLLSLSLYARTAVRELYERSASTEEFKPREQRKIPPMQRGNESAAAKRFRVAFSFAGEKRNFVTQIAALLAARFGEAAILYDKFHEAEFARRDLGFYLPDLYQRETDLVIVVLCPDYKEKEWCGLEWDAIFDLLKHRKDKDVMLCRFDHVLVKGLNSTAGFLELDDMTADQTAARILERLALNDGKSKDHYLSDGPQDSAARPT